MRLGISSSLHPGPKEYLKLIKAVNRERFIAHLDIINMINCPNRYFFPEEFLKETFDQMGSQYSWKFFEVNISF